MSSCQLCLQLPQVDEEIRPMCCKPERAAKERNKIQVYKQNKECRKQRSTSLWPVAYSLPFLCSHWVAPGQIKEKASLQVAASPRHFFQNIQFPTVPHKARLNTNSL